MDLACLVVLEEEKFIIAIVTFPKKVENCLNIGNGKNNYSSIFAASVTIFVFFKHKIKPLK